MAVIFLNQIPDFLPVYSEISVQAQDSSFIGNDDLVYTVTVTSGGQSRMIQQMENLQGAISLDISRILQQFVQSSVFTHITFQDEYDSGVIEYSVTVSATSGGVTRSNTTATKRVFNGTSEARRPFVLSNHVISANSLGNPLNRWTGNRKIHFNDDIYVQFLVGALGADTSSVSELTLTRFQKDGSSSSENISASATSTSQAIYSFNIGPTALNMQTTSFDIDLNTVRYIISNNDDSFAPMTIEILPEISKYDRYYRIGWVDRNGATEFFNFDLSYTESIDVDREFYTNDRQRIPYALEVEEEVQITSNWITDSESLGLRDLWSSIYTVSDESNSIFRINLDSGNVDVNQRHNSGLFNYELTFGYSEIVQIQTR